MGSLTDLLRRAVRTGVTPSTPKIEARYVILTNAAALLGTFFTLGFVPAAMMQPSWYLPAAQLVYAPLYLGAIYLNHRKRPWLATVWLMAASQILALVQVVIDGAELSVQGFLLMSAVLPFLVFSERHARSIAFFCATGFLAFTGVQAFGGALPRLGAPPPPEMLRWLVPLMWAGVFTAVTACAWYARRTTLDAEHAMIREHERSEELLLNILPSPIAERLKVEPATIADAFPEVTVLFADIVGFTKLSARLPPRDIVSLLNQLFSAFDDLAGRLGLEKIKTIGDAYMVAGGLPAHRDDHADSVAEMALGMIAIVADFRKKSGEDLGVRIGINSGPVVAGVIGKRKFIYDLWGDTVNTASRMESHGVPGRIQITEATRGALAGRYRFEERGEIDVKGKGLMPTWFLEERLDEPVDEAA